MKSGTSLDLSLPDLWTKIRKGPGFFPGPFCFHFSRVEAFPGGLYLLKAQKAVVLRTKSA